MKPEPSYPLPRFSVDRPVTVIMILLALLVVGLIAYQRIPIALFPEGYEENSLGVYIPYPNATPKDIEEKIAQPVEEIIGTISNVRKISTRCYPGVMFARISFQPQTDLATAYADLRDRMDRVMPELPDDVERVWVRRWDENDIPIMFLVAKFDEAFGDPYYPADQFLRPALQRIEGVGNVEIFGLEGNDVMIELDQERVQSHGIDVYELTNRLRRENFNLPGGYVYESGKKIYVRSLARFETIEAIRGYVIDAEHNLTLGDIADVNLKRPEREWVYRIDQTPALGIEIVRAANGNIAQISDGVRQVLDTITELPQLKGVEFEVFWDQGTHVKESIHNLTSSGLWGGLFASIVLFLFMRAIRMTVILTLAIPLSILTTVVVMYFIGWSLNMATMMGLLLCIGLVIDNSIVIVENIYRYRQAGLPGRQASIRGAGEVGLAVTTATLTTVVVFLPLILMSDEEEFSFWMLRIGTPVIVALLASLFIALVFVPLAALRLSSGKHHTEPVLLGWLRKRYLRVLQWALHHRVEATLLVLLTMATIVIPAKNLKKTDNNGGGDNNNVWLFFDMPSGQTLERADAFFTRVENSILEYSDLYHIKSVETRFRSNFGRMQVVLKEDSNTEWYAYAWTSLLEKLGLREPVMTKEEVEEHIKEHADVPPGYTLRTNWRDRSDDASVSITLYGEDTETLEHLAREVERRLNTIEGLNSVETDMDTGTTELQVRLDRDQAGRLGVDTRAISGTIAYTLRGFEISKYYTPTGREVDIQVQLKDARNQNMDDLKNLTFTSRDGTPVPLESLASLFVQPSLGGIRRENRETALNVVAKASKSDAKSLFAKVDQAMQGFEMPRGYRWDKGSRYVRMEDSDKSQKFAMIMSICFVFLLMGVLFESFILPLAVIIAIPFSFLGVYWTLFLTGTPLDIMSMIGTVILIGVVVNNAIVLVDLTNRHRHEGMERTQALMEAGRHRFRPILMTTFTTVCGLIPMALGNSKMIGMPYSPLGRTMIGGLLCATFLTLVIVPLFYSCLDDLRNLFFRMISSARQKQPEGTPEAAGR
ncbi:MAG: efflux RND transporter permease subunit [Opitutaceae bacterium]